MVLRKWDPLREMNNMLSRRPGKGYGSGAVWSPAVDIYENDKCVVINVEVPGIPANDIRVIVENNILTLTGERRFSNEGAWEHCLRVERDYGPFSRSFAISRAIRPDKISAGFKDGILKIIVPKKEQDSKPIQVGNA